MTRILANLTGGAALVLLLASPALAQEGGESVLKQSPPTAGEPAEELAAEEATPDKEDPFPAPTCGRGCQPDTIGAYDWPDGGYDSFDAFIEGETARITALDIYGVSGQLPQGYVGFKYDINLITASHRYDRLGNLGPVIPPITFGDDRTDNNFIDMGIGVSGHGSGHNIMVSYGITNALDWYIEVPFTNMDIELHPKARPVQMVDKDGKVVSEDLTPTDANGDPELDENGDPVVLQHWVVDKEACERGEYTCHTMADTFARTLGYDPESYDAGDFIYDTLPRLGMRSPATKYKAKWKLGDINSGFSWNFFRSSRFSAALTGRVFLPTGFIPDSNVDILYATGPALETGIGGWATSATMGYDVRLFKYAPWWLDIVFSSEATIGYAFEQHRRYPTYPKPDPVLQNELGFGFGDLSDLSGKEFSYTPGFSTDWTNQIIIGIGPIGVGVGYGVSYAQEPILDADYEFIQMVKGFELLGDQTTHMMQVGATLSLLPLSIPINFLYSYKFVIGGSNAIVFDDYMQFTVQGVIPLIAFWD